MRKIMFNDKYGLTKCVLEKKKTMTRRLIPESLCKEWDELGHDEFDTLWDKAKYYKERAPFKVGEVIAVAQSYKDLFGQDKNTHWFQDHAGWNNKMFVSAINMKHHIKITGIKVERLQDITEGESLKEGIHERKVRPFDKIDMMYQVPNTPVLKPTAKEAFAVLIDKISGKGTWKLNPMVFAYSFELID